MLKAHSLLYAVYVCLIVSIICGAILYFATLYNQLNLYYNTNENLYIQNQSIVNFALGNIDNQDNLIELDTTEIKSEINIKNYGVLKLLIVKSIAKSDTIVSTNFVGIYGSDKNCLTTSSISKPISYSGTVKLIGNRTLSSPYLDQNYINNSKNELQTQGTFSIAKELLPKVNSFLKTTSEAPLYKLKSLKNITRTKDSIYFNSFQNETIEIEYNNPILDNVIIKGNFILYSKDSMQIRKNAILEDVILKAPNITFSDGFKGTVQAFATQKIAVMENVELNYPSVLCIYNNSSEKSEIIVNSHSKILGAVVLFGNPITQIDKNSIVLNTDSFLIGDVYCTGKTMLQGTVYGSVITNRIFSKTAASTYENLIMNTEIDVTKKPKYFISIPIIDNRNKTYGVYKKVL